MNFERGRKVKDVLRLGALGRRGVSVDHEWIRKKFSEEPQDYQSWHIRALVSTLNKWDDFLTGNTSISKFIRSHPQTEVYGNEDWDRPLFVIKAQPGEKIDFAEYFENYCSDYRIIEYSEIISKFFSLIEKNENGFMNWFEQELPGVFPITWILE